MQYIWMMLHAVDQSPDSLTVLMTLTPVTVTIINMQEFDVFLVRLLYTTKYIEQHAKYFQNMHSLGFVLLCGTVRKYSKSTTPTPTAATVY